MPIGRSRSSSGSGGGGLNEAQVQALINTSQRVILPNMDGTWPDPDTNKDKILLVEGDTAYHVHVDTRAETPNTVTWGNSFPSSLRILGAYTLSNRPVAAAGNQGRQLV
ncbi:MAG: hypothetical protein OXP73_01935 [Chloroflexota bacterium]|nr:hypothetical protein [Chloroflexota bacterium]